MNKTVFLLLIISSLGIGCSPLLTKQNEFSSSISEPLVTSQGRSDFGRGSDIYQLLRGEFAVQSGDFTLSFNIYSTLARNSHDKKLLKKTVNLALLSEKYVEAYFFSKRLCQLVKDYECYAVYTALAAKLDLVDDDFFLESRAERFFSENPGFFLRLISNHLALMRAPISAHAVLLDALKSLDFFDVLSVDHSDMLAVLAIESADYVQAMKYISSHISEKGLNLSLVQLLIAEAEKSLAPTVLRTWINSIRQFFPEDRQLALWEALFLSKLGRYKPAKNLIEKFYINDRDDDHVALSLALLELNANNIDEAKRIFSDLLRRGYAPNEVNFYLGRISELKGRLADALLHYNTVGASANHQIYISSKLRVAFVLAKEKRIQESLATLSVLGSSYPDEFVRISLVKGDILIDNREYLKALEVFGEALKKVNFNFELLYARSLVAERLGRVDILEEDLGRILEADPNNAEALNALGYSLTNLTDRHDEAIVFIRRALTLMPDSYHVLDSMGWVCFNLGKLNESLKYLRQAYSLVRDPEVAAHLIEVLWVGGRESEAKGLLEDLIKEFPKDEKLESLRKRLKLI